MKKWKGKFQKRKRGVRKSEGVDCEKGGEKSIVFSCPMPRAFEMRDFYTCLGVLILYFLAF